MTNDSISSPRFQLDGAANMGQPRDDADERLFDGWFDPIESAVRDRVARRRRASSATGTAGGRAG